MIIYCEKHQQTFDTDRFEECPRCADRPKFEPPAMPRSSSFFYPTSLHLDTIAYEEALESWGHECANLAQREAALADELNIALEKAHQELGWVSSMLCEGPDVISPQQVIDAARRELAKVYAVINAAKGRHKEARNG